MEIIRRAYFGVPGFFGELFRATRTPSIILLVGLLGIPLAASVYLYVYASSHRSVRPAELLVIGIAELQVEGNPNVAATLPPNISRLLRAASPADKELGKEVFYGYAIFGFIEFGAILWWIVAAFKFFRRRYAP